MAAVSSSGEQNGGRAEEEHPLFPDLLPGYVFSPTDDELILDYLVPKIMGAQLPCNAIRYIDFYGYDPNDLPTGDFKHGKSKKKAYYFTQLKMNSETGGPERSSKGGYWNASDNGEIDSDEEIVGFKTIFDFYYRKEKWGIGKKSSWVMHEYRIHHSNAIAIFPREALKDDTIKAKMENWVICKIAKEDDMYSNNTEEDFIEQGGSVIKSEEEENSSDKEEDSNDSDDEGRVDKRRRFDW